jgi:predicted nucleotidyltransferase
MSEHAPQPELRRKNSARIEPKCPIIGTSTRRAVSAQKIRGQNQKKADNRRKNRHEKPGIVGKDTTETSQGQVCLPPKSTRLKHVDKFGKLAFNLVQGTSMNEYVRQIKQAVVPILRRYGVSKAALFGSIVKNRMRPDSDIDMLVQIDQDISLLDFVGLKIELEESLNRNVDLVEYDTIKPLIRERILKEQEMIL